MMHQAKRESGKIVLSLAGALFGMAMAEAGVDWSKVTGTYTVEAGASEVVTDADLPYVNALTKLTVNGSVRFDTTAAPTMPLAGTGDCSKTNGSDWTVAVAWADWKGVWTFDGAMTVYYGGYQALGSALTDADGNPLSEVRFRNGATLNLNVQPSGGKGWLGAQRVRISGTGKDGQGVIWASNVYSMAPDRQLGNVVLDGDATVRAKYFLYLSYGTLELNGHKLTYVVDEMTHDARSLQVGPQQRIAGPGEIALAVPLKTYSTDDFQFLDSTPRTKLTLLGGGKLCFFLGSSTTCRFPVQYVDLEVHGVNTLEHYHSGFQPEGDPGACGVTVCGRVDIPTETDELDVVSTFSGKYYPKCPIRIDGDIVGAGRLRISKYSLSEKDGQFTVYSLAGTNSTITGERFFNLSRGGTVRLAHPKSLGSSFTAVTNFNGQLAPAVGGTGDPWTTNDLAKLVRETTFLGTLSLIALDASGAPGGTNALSAAFWSDAAAGKNAYLGSYAGEVSLRGPVSANGRFVAAGGTLRLTGEEPILIAAAGAKTLNYAQRPGTLQIDGTDAVTLSEQRSISLPLAAQYEFGSETLGQGGRMVVSNATFDVNVPTVSSGDVIWSSQADRAITVGAIVKNNASYGILEVGADADMTAKITLAEGANAVGAVFQTGGTVRNVGQWTNGDRAYGPVLAYAGRGYLEIDGGAWEQHGRTLLTNGDGADFLLNLRSGSFSCVRHLRDTHESVKGWGANLYSYAGVAHLYASGGTIAGWDFYFQHAAKKRSDVVITLDGPDARLDLTGHLSYNMETNATGDFILNLNDGVWMQKTYSMIGPGAYDKTTGLGVGSVRAYVNFNGGTCGYDDGLASGSSRFMFNDVRENLQLTVFAGGAKFKPVGDGEVRVFRPLRAPKGKGVAAIPLPAALADAVFVCPPAVRIAETGTDGAGGGASAIALWDRATGRVTGFRVTGAGDGYTEATATISCGSSKSWTQVCTLGENAKTGGLVKTGAGVLSFYVGGSDYRGVTEVCEGTVQCHVDYSLPTNGAVWMSGGTIELYGREEKFSSVGGTGGMIRSGESRAMTFDCPSLGTTAGFTLKSIVPTFAGAWTIAAADLAAGATTVYDANVTFADGATVAVDDLGALDAQATYEIFRVADGRTLTGQPAFADPSRKWRLRRRGNALQLVARKGLVLFFR